MSSSPEAQLPLESTERSEVTPGSSMAQKKSSRPCPVRSSKLVFDTADLEPRHRFDAARAYFDGFFEPTPVGAAESYSVRNVSWRIGGFVANCARNGPTANAMCRDHAMRDYDAIRYLARGSYLIVTDDGFRRIGPGSLSSGADLGGISTEGYAFYSLEAPRDGADRRPRVDGALRIPPADSPSGRILLEMMSAVFEGLEEDGSTSPESLVAQTSALFELLADGTDVAEEAARPEYLRARAAAMLRYIDAHLDHPNLAPASLAAAFGLSRAGVFRALEPLGGVATVIARRRMVRAYGLLAAAEPRRGLVRAVAEACGYPDPAHFCRVFRRHLDLSPGDVAQLERPAPVAVSPEASIGPVMPRLSQTYR